MLRVSSVELEEWLSIEMLVLVDELLDSTTVDWPSIEILTECCVPDESVKVRSTVPWVKGMLSPLIVALPVMVGSGIDEGEELGRGSSATGCEEASILIEEDDSVEMPGAVTLELLVFFTDE